MSVIRPFRGLRPKPEVAAEIASPPYDVIDSDEARAMAEGRPLSFLHVVKPEIDLPPETDLYDPKVYAKAAENLKRLRDEGHMVQDERASLYVYRQRMGDHVQTGVVVCASAEEYEKDLIKKHELTRREKEDDRTRHVDVADCNAGPVFLTYRAQETIDGLVAEATKGEPAYDFTAPDGVVHTLWVVDDAPAIEGFVGAFAGVPCLYVADGHHRTASGWRVQQLRKERNPNHTGDEEYNFFMAVLFPHDQLQIFDYNRAVKDLRGLSEEQFLERVRERFEVAPTDEPRPAETHRFGMYLGGAWYRLVAKPGSFDDAHPVRKLDVSILQENLLAPVLGIEDPRTDDRIKFVGGIRGLGELERLVDGGGFAVAFAMHPTSVEELMAIADAGEIMPPKSTWFEPKLRSGLVVHLLGE